MGVQMSILELQTRSIGFQVPHFCTSQGRGSTSNIGVFRRPTGHQQPLFSSLVPPATPSSIPKLEPLKIQHTKQIPQNGPLANVVWTLEPEGVDWGWNVHWPSQKKHTLDLQPTSCLTWHQSVPMLPVKEGIPRRLIDISGRCSISSNLEVT